MTSAGNRSPSLASPDAANSARVRWVMRPQLTIPVYYDFASTLCYVAHKVLCEAEQQIADLGVALEWRPIDLTMTVPWERGDSFNPEVRSSVRETGLALGLDVEMPELDGISACRFIARDWDLSLPAAEAAARARAPAAWPALAQGASAARGYTM